MRNDFRRSRVYRLAVHLTSFLYRHTRNVPSDAKPISRQMLRSVASIGLNIGEGAGEYSPLEKARFYRYARRSATETIGGLDMLFAMKLVHEEVFKRADAALDEITAMLTTMTKNQEAAAIQRTRSSTESSRSPEITNVAPPRKSQRSANAASPGSSSPSPSPSPSP